MENEKKGTIYQQLNSILNFDGLGFEQDDQKGVAQTKTEPIKDEKILIKGNSPEEIQRKGLELQQKKDLQSKFFRTTDRGFQKALQYEAARLPAYIDYEGMEYYPLISSALDLFMEECTTIGHNGKMLNIYSNKERIKHLLEEFFYDIVNVNVNLPFWTRNLPIRQDSVIPLLDGTEKTIKEIAVDLKNNPQKEIWTYSVQDDTKKIVPSKIIWCDLTRSNSKLLRINLDDGTYVETTPDHEFMLRNGEFIQSQNLKSGDSLMPFYTKESKTPKDNISGYEKVYNPSSNHYKYTHTLVAHELIRDVEKEKNKIFDTHHKKILNHNVVTVEWLKETDDVYCMEVVGSNNEQDRHNFPICSKNENGEYSRNGIFVSNCKYGDNFVLLYGERKKGLTHVKQLVNYEIERFERIQDGKPIVKFKERMTGDEFNVFEIGHFRLLGDDKYLPYGSSLLNKIRRVFRQCVMAEDAMLTYRIVRAGEKKVFKIDVGNIDDDDIEDYIYKVATKFKKLTSVAPNDGQIDYRFNILGNDEDYFLPVRNANVQTGIETLPGADNLDAIQDIEYLRDNLFMGLGIPKPFLSFQDAAGGGKNLAQFDIRFSKKVNRIQQAIIQELNKMAMIHLYLLGYSNNDLNDFTLTLTNPSTQMEMLQSELFREKAQTYTELTRGDSGIGAMSHTLAKRLIFNMTDGEIVDDLKKQKMEKVIMQELADAPVKIKTSGLFSDIDKKYGSDEESPEELGAKTGEEATTPPAGEEGGGAVPPPDTGAGAVPTPDTPAGGGGDMPALSERKGMSDDEYNDIVNKVVYGDDENSTFKKQMKEKKLINENDKKNIKLNKNAHEYINEIDDLLKKGKIFDNKKKGDMYGDDINIDDIEKIDLDENKNQKK